MKYAEKLEAMREFVEENFHSAKDLVDFLEISIEDIMMLFPDSLVNNYEKVFMPDLVELDEMSDLAETEAWLGVDTYGVVIPGKEFFDDL